MSSALKAGEGACPGPKELGRGWGGVGVGVVMHWLGKQKNIWLLPQSSGELLKCLEAGLVW